VGVLAQPVRLVNAAAMANNRTKWRGKECDNMMGHNS